MPRFYCPHPLAEYQDIELAPEVAHHAVRVLRLKSGSALVLFDGLGGQYPATLTIEGKKAYAHVGAHDPIERELAGDITLAQGIPASDKMDWIIEKAVELGASRLIPITAQRSVVQLGGERLAKRLSHWNRIACNASEQCGRNRIMPVDAPISLQDCLQGIIRPANRLALFCHPDAKLTLAEALTPNTRGLTILIGPEGGWSDDEQALARHYAVTPVKFGTRVLRSETAGMALIAAISAMQNWN